MTILSRLILLFMLFLTNQSGIATTLEFTEQQYDVSHIAQGEEIYSYDNNSNLQHCCQVPTVVNTQDRSFLALVGDFLVTKKGLTTPNKYFGSKTYKEAEKALTNKFGAPRGGGKNNKSFFNEKTKRTYNLHKDPSHRGGKGHIDVRKRDLPTNYYKNQWGQT
jgi:hypothetical protein